MHQKGLTKPATCTGVTWLFFNDVKKYIDGGQQTIPVIMVLVLSAMCLVLNGLNIFWFSKMTKIAYQMLLKKPKKKENEKEG